MIPEGRLTGARVLFLEGTTLIAEPPVGAEERLDEMRLAPNVIAALLDLKRAGFRFVMLAEEFGAGHPVIRALLASQGIEFDAVLAGRQAGIDPIGDYVRANPIDTAHSCMIGGRDSHMEWAASLGVEGINMREQRSPAPWPDIAQRLAGAARRARIRRTTRETDIEIDLDLSRAGPSRVASGLGFFDHMLGQIAQHGGFALRLSCKGDLHIDEHHTVEDCALALGAALRQALGDKRGIARYGFLLAMDEAEAQIALDLSGRPYFVWEGRFNRERVGDLPTELVPHFFRSLAETLGAALHVSVRGENTHHMVESCFKGVGRSLRQAIRIEDRELPTTKGVL